MTVTTYIIISLPMQERAVLGFCGSLDDSEKSAKVLANTGNPSAASAIGWVAYMADLMKQQEFKSNFPDEISYPGEELADQIRM